MFRPRLLRASAPRIATCRRAAVYPARPARRFICDMPTLREDFSNGVPDFLTGKAFNLAWTEYQTLMLDRLNSAISGTAYEDDTPWQILLSTAREPSLAHIFNHASMAHNNHFFFDGIASNPRPMDPTLDQFISQSFGSLKGLRNEMLGTAVAMFGPGFVWLVRVNPSRAEQRDESQFPIYRVMPTYLAGSPYAGAHWRRQGVDMNTSAEAEFHRPIAAYRGAPAGAAPTAEQVPLGGVHVVPLLCINTWEHVFMEDYGVGKRAEDGRMERGKMEYVLRWWEKIDWERVLSLSQRNGARVL